MGGRLDLIFVVDMQLPQQPQFTATARQLHGLDIVKHWYRANQSSSQTDASDKDGLLLLSHGFPNFNQSKCIG